MTLLHRCPDGPNAELAFYDQAGRRRAPRSLHVIRTKQHPSKPGAETTHRMSLPLDETLVALAIAVKGFKQ